MMSLPDPVWPVVVLALIQLGDAVLCIKPVGFIARCFQDVNFPRNLWWVMTPIKLAATAGLIAGIWIPWLGFVTCGALILYFVLAIVFHIRARDFGRNLFVNAIGMLLICIVTMAISFL